MIYFIVLSIYHKEMELLDSAKGVWYQYTKKAQTQKWPFACGGGEGGTKRRLGDRAESAQQNFPTLQDFESESELDGIFEAWRKFSRG